MDFEMPMSTIDNYQVPYGNGENERMPEARFAELRQIRTRYFQLAPQSDAATVLFIHGGIAFADSLAMSATLWERNLGRIGSFARAYAYDVPGQSHPAIATLDDVVEHARDFMHHIGGSRIHVVGHGDGGIVALKLALACVDRVRSVTVVGSNAAPLGDGVTDFTISDPPVPLESHDAQRWLTERISYSEHHLNVGRFLDDAVDVARRRSRAVHHQDSMSAAERRRMRASIARARADLFSHCRVAGLPVPVMLVWGFQDPIVPFKHALALFNILSEKTPEVQLRFINRAGNMPFRERPDEFSAALAGFIGALEH
ncbi:hypothetical protein A9R05_41015 (plasmid) [Burkholderia sp. KK1]|nr:hypothetical protein A9R05_41015 [Burkholderia sp. KK1]